MTGTVNDKSFFNNTNVWFTPLSDSNNGEEKDADECSKSIFDEMKGYCIGEGNLYFEPTGDDTESVDSEIERSNNLLFVSAVCVNRYIVSFGSYSGRLGSPMPKTRNADEKRLPSPITVDDMSISDWEILRERFKGLLLYETILSTKIIGY